MAKDRFIETYSKGIANIRKILVDKETGVNYLIVSTADTGGCAMSVLVDRDGKPIVTPITFVEQ